MTTPPPAGIIGSFAEGVKIVGGVMAFGLVGRKVLQSGRTVKPLYNRLESKHATLEEPIIPFTVNPYKQLVKDRALILQGETMTGKTMCLAASIPWYRRHGMPPFIRPVYGLYFNGAEGAATSSFDMWVRTQMFGLATQGGPEVTFALEKHLASQRFRSIGTTYFGFPPFLQPKPAIVIIDHLEDLMRRHPTESLNWVNQLTNTHVRDNKARLIFVVNSEDAVKSIQGLSQQDRWKVVTLGVDNTGPSPIPADYFTACESNIGLYKRLKRDDVQLSQAEVEARELLRLWREQFHVPYPLLAASWRLLSVVELKKQLLSALEKKITPEKHAILERHLEEMEKEQILAATQQKWEDHFKEGGMKRGAGELAIDVKTALGNEAPTVDAIQGK